MSLNSTLCDMIARIQNGQQSRKLEIFIIKTKLCLKILDILKNEGYIRDYYENGKFIKVLLKYSKDKPVITKIRAVLPNYKNTYLSIKLLRELRSRNNDLSSLILSTPKGILTDYNCILNNTGGRILIEVF